ncbi:MAG: DUF2877 domain-containing protein [Actinomycetia bacterium]|nr:DUF2877 domain-containing protein [Actinomycetes bacterium]
MSPVAAASVALRAADGDTLVVVETVAGPRFPNGVILDSPTADAVPGGTNHGGLMCGPTTPRDLGWSLPLSARRWWDPTCPVGSLDPSLVRAFVAGLDPLTLPNEPAASIGWGPGLTPAGDDVVVGMLIGFHAAGAPREARQLADACAGAETTPFSRSLLDHATVGETVRPVLDLVRALGRHGELGAAVEGLRQFGATSGAHILDGLRQAFSQAPSLIQPEQELMV